MRILIIVLLISLSGLTHSDSISYDSLNGLSASFYYKNTVWEWDGDFEEMGARSGATSHFRFVGAELGSEFLIAKAGVGGFYCCVGVKTDAFAIAIPLQGQSPYFGYMGSFSPFMFQMKYGILNPINEVKPKFVIGAGIGY